MPLREDLLTPIAGENPSGSDLRYDAAHAFYDRIQEARRQDDDLPVGDWQRERKVANYADVLKLSQEAIATQSKDLQIAAWLTEALLHTDGFSGLSQGIQFCHQMLSGFWDNLYPVIDDGDSEMRARPLNWLGSALELSAKSRPLTTAGHDWIRYKESRTVGYEEHAQTEAEKKKRKAMVAEGKLTPETFDKAFDETPKIFYAKTEKDLDSCLSKLGALEKFCDEKFGSAAPSFNRLKASLGEVRHTVHGLLEKKRELEPDPVEAQPAADETGAAESNGDGNAVAASSRAYSIVIPLANAEPVERRQAIAAIARAAAALRSQQPGNPAPYLMMRGLRWGELRASPGLTNPSLMEAPATELRQHLKLLALASSWSELLEVAENAMSLPCSRAWLDLQHLVVLACGALGQEYALVEAAILSELKNLLRDIPELLNATLLDGTSAANSDTRTWLSGLMAPTPAMPVEVQAATTAEGSDGSAPPGVAAIPPTATSSWWEKPADAYVLSQAAVRSGNVAKGVAIMREEIARQQSGRARFQRTLQFVRLCVEGGHESIVQPMIDDVVEALETHKLDDWEDREMVAEALVLIMKTSKKVQADNSQRQKLFDRVCRLDPVRALHVG